MRALPALLLASCFPQPLDESGRRCDEMHTCSSGFLCFDGVCLKPEDIDALYARYQTAYGQEVPQ